MNLKYSFYHLFFVLILMVCACSNPQQNSNSAVTEQSAKKEAIDTADTRLANDLSVFCTSQVNAAKLAQTKASTQKVKKFAKETAEIYAQLNTRLNVVAEKYDIVLPAAVPASASAKIKQLSAIKEALFDHEYLLQMLKLHNITIREINAAKNIHCIPLKMFVVSNQGAIIKQAYALSDLKEQTP
jgi:predicted outer membrane protein